jgi:hypothetical protein
MCDRLLAALLWFLMIAIMASVLSLVGSLPTAKAQPPAQAPQAAPAATEADPDLTMPAFDLCAGPDRSQMACFDQAELRQLLRLQEHARFGYQLSELNERLTARFEAMIRELQAAQARYVELREVIEERNANLRESLIEARAEAEKYRGRAERRRIWPWVALGLGLVTGAVGGVALVN